MITALNNSCTEIPLFIASTLITLILSCRRDNMNLAIVRPSPSFRPIPLPLPFALPFGTRNESTPVRDTPLTLTLLQPSPPSPHCSSIPHPNNHPHPIPNIQQ